jgi:C-terminal processing protease CtpA/Prc
MQAAISDRIVQVFKQMILLEVDKQLILMHTPGIRRDGDTVVFDTDTGPVVYGLYTQYYSLLEGEEVWQAVIDNRTSSSYQKHSRVMQSEPYATFWSRVTGAVGFEYGAFHQFWEQLDDATKGNVSWAEDAAEVQITTDQHHSIVYKYYPL